MPLTELIRFFNVADQPGDVIGDFHGAFPKGDERL